MLHAHSPQAKGRVERLFKTVQDRLVKELRLADIATREAANRFLEGYLPTYNQRFSVSPAQAADLHRPRPPRRDLARSLCLKSTHVLRRDWTVVHHGHLYQVQTPVRATHVQVEERLDGTLRITHQGQPLKFHAIEARPVKKTEGRTAALPRRAVTPKPTHPWRKRVWPARETRAAVAGI